MFIQFSKEKYLHTEVNLSENEICILNEHGLKHLYTSEPKSFCYCTTLGIREGLQYTSHYLKTWIFLYTQSILAL